MSVADKDIYRLVPFRFLVHDANSDICKLEKLTNLFPDMKAIIELELFKINNLTRIIERLSNIFTVLTAVDTRDDTLHLFLGPYHLSLGPAIYGALHFKNVSRALLASSHSKPSSENTHQYHKRRHDAVLRRFRRAVRKLIHIKSIIDQLRLASILTPYNQYELYTHGIYDLVLAGHIHNSHSVFDDDDFTQQINDFRSMNNLEKENSLLASKFVKVNTLLHLLSPTLTQPENNSVPGKIPQTRSDDSSAYPTDENSSKSLLNSRTLCCTQHSQNTSLVRFPINRSISHQPTHFLPPESRSRRNSKHYAHRNSLFLPEQSITNSLPDLSNVDNFNANTTSNSAIYKSEKSQNLVAVQPYAPYSRLNTNREDAFVNRISSLFTNYLLTRELTAISSNTHNNYHKLGDSTDSLLAVTSTMAADDSDVSNQFSSVIESNEFEKLLQRIKTVVDNNLSDHQNSSHNSVKTTTPNNLEQQLLISRAISFQKTPIDEFNIQHLKPSIDRRKLNLSFKSQSFDDANLHKEVFLAIPESNDNSVEF